MAIEFVVCLDKEHLGDLSGEDLQLGRVYAVVEWNAGGGMVRIIDDSGEDYLYPRTCFGTITLQDQVAERLTQILPGSGYAPIFEEKKGVLC